MNLPRLPIQEVINEIRKTLAVGSCVLAGPPGCGKTTIVPLALLNETWLKGKKIIILEPRRLAARTAAARMASLLGEKVGERVGYQIRFERRVSQLTRIEVVTEGILTRRIQNDAALGDVGLIIFDEYHERSLHADLALALSLDLLQLREDLRLLVMSATLETAGLAELLDGVPVIEATGSLHEVAVDYLDRPGRGRISESTVSGIQRVLKEKEGDILAFLPGKGEILDAERLLADVPGSAAIRILPLFGDLRQSRQDEVLMPDREGRRRVILATSIAETSLTIEGIANVVDSGWSRRPRFDPGSGLTRLVTVRVSRAAANQRAGRAGRLGPGYCLRLWTREEHHGLIPFHPPEIVGADLAGLALDLALWGVSDPNELSWLDPPRQGAFEQARELLFSLDAISVDGRITDKGRELAVLPLHPRLGHMLLMAKEEGYGALACDIAALITERDVFRGHRDENSVELSLRLDIIERWRKDGRGSVDRDGADPAACRRVDRVAAQWRRMIGAENTLSAPDEAGNLLVYAYPDRVGKRRWANRSNYLLSSGRGALLPPGDPLTASEYLVAPHLDGAGRDARIFLAEPVTIDELKEKHANLLSWQNSVDWDDAADRVVAVQRLCLGGIIVEEKEFEDVEPNEITEALLKGVQRLGLEALPWTTGARRLQARVTFMQARQPQNDWPDFTKEALRHDLGWLLPYLGNMRSRTDLQQLDLETVFKTRLGWEKQQILDRDAPESYRVPSGSKIKLSYTAKEPPILAVRIQELLGLSVHPTICGGQVPLLLHLLSPAQRPVQITSDLAGFWKNSYPEVKKELKGRYPKHFWPEDPLQAEPTKRIKMKKKKS